MQPTSIQLLYQSPQTIVNCKQLRFKLLNLKLSLVNIAINALNLFYVEKAIDKFDPHVGETACQIRAYKTLLIYHSLSKKTKFDIEIKNLKKLRDDINKIIGDLTHTWPGQEKNKNQGECLEIFLKKHKLIVTMSNESIFLTLSYLLSKFKMEDINSNSSLDYKKLSNELNTSKKLAKKLIHDYQVKISEDSVKFVKALAHQIPNNSYLNILDQLNHLDDDNRSVLPCYLTIKILYEHMLINNIPILLVAHTYNSSSKPILLLFVPDNNKKFYISVRTVSDISACFNKPSIIISGIYKNDFATSIFSNRQHIEHIVNIGIEKILLGNMASHPQYSGTRLSHLRFNPFEFIDHGRSNSFYPRKKTQFEIKYLKILEKELLEMKQFAGKFGLSETNFSLFLIRHISCDTIANQLKKFKKLAVDNIDYFSLSNIYSNTEAHVRLTLIKDDA